MTDEDSTPTEPRDDSGNTDKPIFDESEIVEAANFTTPDTHDGELVEVEGWLPYNYDEDPFDGAPAVGTNPFGEMRRPATLLGYDPLLDDPSASYRSVSDLITLSEGAALTGRSTYAIRRAIKSGRLEAASRATNLEPLRVSREDLIRWAEGHAREPRPAPDTQGSTITELEARLAAALQRAEAAEREAETARELAAAERGRAEAERGRAEAEAKRAETLTAVLALSAANPNRQPRRWWRKAANPQT